LKNRFYVGDVVYRGEIHKGEHEPNLDFALFEAVQWHLGEGAVERSRVRRSSSALLAGTIFDDRNNPMTPTHANKQGSAIVTMSPMPCFRVERERLEPLRACPPRMSNNS
jgi:hypothetical protein